MDENQPAREGSGVVSTFVTIVVGLVIAVVVILAKIGQREADEQAFQARMEENSRMIEVMRQQDQRQFEMKVFGASSVHAIDNLREKTQALGTVSAFVNRLESDELAAAYQMTTPDFRGRVSEASFAEMVQKYPAVRNAEQRIAVITMRHRDGRTESLQMGSDGQAQSLHLRKVEDGDQEAVVVSVSVEKSEKWMVSDVAIRSPQEPAK